MEFIRFSEVCQVKLSGYKVKTDSKGNAYFDEFKIEMGPEALYTFQYVITVNSYTQILSEEFEVYAISKINVLEGQNANPLLDFVVMNQPLQNQPIVIVKDYEGKPMAGKKVIAFSWVQPTLNPRVGKLNSPSNDKVFVLKNTISEVSDENGIARFTDLTITGTSESIAYIHFY
jgi:hypothetical protein